MKVNLDGEGTVILINNEKDEGIANFPSECFLRIPCVGEYIAHLDKSYIVNQVIHSFRAVALLVTEVDL